MKIAASNQFAAIVSNDYFAPQVPCGTQLIFQRGELAKIGDIVAVPYSDNDPDFCKEPFREGVGYVTVAIQASFSVRKSGEIQNETPESPPKNPSLKTA
ncbi:MULTISPECIES: hypothetical protein [Methylomonas]|uniref:Uncharacterized protein n=1 Tax=Methylomonas methanica TaxID=421 RepID=A0ABY2CI57_METMH|nr:MULTISPECIES: hypothetical protein [Methylomonas]TCV79135.1 hypothetical protein EDE11_1218 [Methylomonas methanica]